ncbi:Fur family transcriptional regulator [Pseudooceanicola nanhaiensis]|uniref:Fur family transcriptional regulator n=1 Tax=Pseudooceanicola nanhaiensis TaxID=375761 RepID=UPI001CD61F70|nr:Fur family transcriptional regulator [Pseudooceanicola nanhaiensis]MCA0920508.1 transcriptional repressor [Pseudooceanicola nanhaiensis]
MSQGSTDPQGIVGFAAHDHSACTRAALALAEETCAEKGLSFTPVRRRTLEILLESHVALGAYDVLARLAEDGFGSKPPVAYRALGFLMDNGLAHRIERLNAFVACAHPGAAHDPAFFICRKCGAVAEAQGVTPLDASADAAGFAVEKTTIEAEGLCPLCREEAA